MRCFRRYLSVFCCLAMLFSGFSVNVSAEERDNPYHVWFTPSVYADGNLYHASQLVVYPDNGEVDFAEWENTFNTQNRIIVDFVYKFANDDDTPLIPMDRTCTIRIENINLNASWLSNALMSDITNSWTNEFSIYITYTDGTVYRVGDSDITLTRDNDGFYDIYFNFHQPDYDVDTISVNSTLYITPMSGASTTVYLKYGEIVDGNQFQLTIDMEEEETGLIRSIIGWVVKIWNTLSDGFTNLVNGIRDVANYILELPGKIWQYIEDGLKSLFIPSEEYMVQYSDTWQELMYDRFGAVYQAFMVIDSLVSNIDDATATKTIVLPVVTIPMPEGNTFSFGGYSVKVVPEGFDFLAQACQFAFGITGTLLFLNGLRKKYDEIMGAS